MSSNRIDPVARVTISTIQRLYSTLKGEPELDPELDEHSSYELVTEPVPVEYSAAVPIETFDVVIVDECHRSIYGLWRQVLDYFDAFTIGLTATPNKQAFGFFNQNLVMEYTHEQAVADQVNVDFDVYRIRTEITEVPKTLVFAKDDSHADDIVQIVQEDKLVLYPELVSERFRAWLLSQESAGRTFTPEQRAWLERIRDHVAASLSISTEDFEYVPFVEHGGLGKAYQLFGAELVPLLEELNAALAA